ncbi:MAG: acireductone synthase, partial [Lysobacteraceae bacterium]
HSEAGDLTGLFSGWFDTEIGGKRDAGSYEAIAARLGVDPTEILFLSDVVEELDAARIAGMQTVLVDRPEDYPHPREGQAANGHHRATSFAALRLDGIH